MNSTDEERRTEYRMRFQNLFADIGGLKKQQWRIVYNYFLLYAGIIGITKILDELSISINISSFIRLLFIAAPLLIAIPGLVIIIINQFNLQNARITYLRIDERLTTHDEFKELRTDRDRKKLKRYDKYFYQYHFIGFLIAIIIGAVFVLWYLQKFLIIWRMN